MQPGGPGEMDAAEYRYDDKCEHGKAGAPATADSRRVKR